MQKSEVITPRSNFPTDLFHTLHNFLTVSCYIHNVIQRLGHVRHYIGRTLQYCKHKCLFLTFYTSIFNRLNQSRNIYSNLECTLRLHLKSSLSQQAASISGIPTQGVDSISQPGKAEKAARGRGSPVVRNLSLLFTDVIFLGASSSGKSQQGAGSSRKPVDEGDLHSLEVSGGNLKSRKSQSSTGVLWQLVYME